MINFIYGVSGSGKSTLIEQSIKEDIALGRQVYLIVPEQQTYVTERRYTSILPPASQLCFEAVNFTRLSNIARRRYGGLCYNYIDNGTKTLLMWRNLRELAPLLEEYGDAARSPTRLSSLTDMMLTTVGELQAAAITPAVLEHTAEKLPHDSSLYRRLRDISLIWASHSNLIAADYDDAAEDLSQLAQLLREHDLFGGRRVYIDSFTSYTEQEYRVIDMIMKQADEVTVAVGCEKPGSRRMHFASLSHASDKLRALAQARGGCHDIILGDTRRPHTPDLALVEKYIWQTESGIPDDERTEPTSISVVRARTPYDEAEAAASRICEAMRGGMRCRDIAVIMRDASSWQGVIDAVFDKFGIPYFLSEHTELTSKPLFKLLMSALAVKNHNWRQNDVISLIKTGLCGFSDRECDVFEDYCTTWNITGQHFLDHEWSMNPDGYVTEMSERARDILRVANDVRARLVAPLLTLFAELDAASSVAEQCRALYMYTEQIGVRDALDALSDRASAAGDIRAAQDALRLYNVYIESLDKVASALSDTEPDTEQLASALRMIFENTRIGSLPTRHDEVTIGSASLLRADSPRLVIVMGLCEGEFPAVPTESGLFSFSDRARLGELGLDLTSDPAVESADELFFAYRALTAPSESLMLTYSESGCDGSRRQPSRVIEQICTIFPSLSVIDYDLLSPLARIQTPENALEYLSSLGDSPESELLRAALEKNEAFSRYIAALDIPVSDSDCRISEQTSKRLFGERMALSQSRLESYVLCPFRYYCDYVLGLRESGRADFSYSSVGVFIHYVMETFMRRAMREDGFDPELDDAAAIALANEIIEQYSRRLIPSDDERHSRMTFLLSRLRRIALVLIYNIMEEFRHSLFRPSFFELNMDGSDPSLASATFGTGEGDSIRLRGVVDRVDLFRQGDDVYIRVVDYKTGSKTYSPEDVADGIGLQLLLYLFALCNTKDEKFRRAVGCPEGGHIYPAGALYLSANLPVITVDEHISPEDIRRRAAEYLKRSGPLLDDENILRAMNDALDPNFLGTPKSSRGRDNKLSLEGFEALCDDIEKTIGSIRAEMRSGNASAAPRRKKGGSPCDNCSYSAVCRSAEPSQKHK
ncbi:MAG: exodeoxyribonuclease V subunit gamma [Clostridia bacterium]|nr:exodeoxyribonuclease V subunit gamma [Clostridia bacterium]